MHPGHFSVGRIGLLGVLLLAFWAAAVLAAPGALIGYSKVNNAVVSAAGIVLDDLDEFGDSVADLGDLDGPGPSVRALAVGAISDDDGGSHHGAVHILFLDAGGNILSKSKISSTAGNFSGVLDSDDEFGGSVAWLGDLDGPGPSVGALAVGAIGDDDGAPDIGAVWILFLAANGQVLSHQKISATSGNLTASLFPADEFGGAVAGLGDLDGPGPSAGALAVGAIGDDDGGFNRGCVYVLFLGSNGMVLSYSKISSTAGGLTGPLDDNDNFAEDIATMGDLDGAGPGVVTMAVCAVDDDDGGGDRGAVYLLDLNASGAVIGEHKISNTQGGFTGPLATMDNFGSAVVHLGDLDGPGPSIGAMAVSAGSDDGLGLNRGAIYVLFLDSSYHVSSYIEYSSTAGGFDTVLDDNDEFGASLTALGDLDGAGPGGVTLVSGVGYDDDGGLDRGAVYLMNLEGSAAPDDPPVVSAPPTVTVDEDTPLVIHVSVSDANGDPIASLGATGLPDGATFTPGAGNTSGTLEWTPGYDQSGDHVVTFTAMNALQGSAMTTITVSDVDRAPAVTAPPTVSGVEGALLSIDVTAADPDGDVIGSLEAQGLPAGAMFTPNGDHTAGTLEWTPTAGQAGQHTVTFVAQNALQGSSPTDITIGLLGVGDGAGWVHPMLVPSPMRSHAVLLFATSREGLLEVSVLDLSGRRVRQLASEQSAPAGFHQLAFDGRGDDGTPLHSGTYFYRIRSLQDVRTGRFVIAR